MMIKKWCVKLGGAKDKAEAVMRKSVNRTATHLVKPIKEEALKNYAVTNIRKKDIQKTLKVYKAKKGAEVSAGVMSIAYSRVPLYRFETSRRTPVKKNPPKSISARGFEYPSYERIGRKFHSFKGLYYACSKRTYWCFRKRIGGLPDKT